MLGLAFCLAKIIDRGTGSDILSECVCELSLINRGHPMSRGASDRNLLVGMLAFQNGFVRREQLLAAMNAWLVEKEIPLEEILFRRGALDADKQQLLVALVRQHLAMHDNVAERSLTAISSVGSVREELRSLADPDLNASLLHVAAVNGADRFETVPPTVGATTSQGGRFRIREHPDGLDRKGQHVGAAKNAQDLSSPTIRAAALRVLGNSASVDNCWMTVQVALQSSSKARLAVLATSPFAVPAIGCTVDFRRVAIGVGHGRANRSSHAACAVD